MSNYFFHNYSSNIHINWQKNSRPILSNKYKKFMVRNKIVIHIITRECEISSFYVIRITKNVQLVICFSSEYFFSVNNKHFVWYVQVNTRIDTRKRLFAVLINFVYFDDKFPHLKRVLVRKFFGRFFLWITKNKVHVIRNSTQ